MINKTQINILVIDGQGGKLGRQLIVSIREANLNVHITAVGTNTIATTNMMKAGVDVAVTGENAVVYNARHADIIVGPIGIVVADSLFGEITPLMAQAIGQSRAFRVLIPINKCHNIIVGSHNLSLTKLIESTIDAIKEIIS
jgi:hypothetical protein